IYRHDDDPRHRKDVADSKPPPRTLPIRKEMIDQSQCDEHEEHSAQPPGNHAPPKMDDTHELEFAIYLTRGPVAQGPKSERHQAEERSHKRSHRSDGASLPVATGISAAAGDAQRFHQAHEPRRGAPDRSQQAKR